MKNIIAAFFVIAVAMTAFISCANCTYSEELGACVEDLPQEGNTTDNATTPDNTVIDADNTAPAIGHEGGACFENGTCMEGLDCIDISGKDVCVDLNKNDDNLSDATVTDDATTTDMDVAHAGDEGEPCLTGNKCNGNFVCHEATQICVLPETGKEGEGCFPNKTCLDGLVCDQASENITDTCVKVIGVVGEKNGSCKADRTCNTGLVCFRADFICLDMPTVGSATFCWDRELNTDPVVSYCGSIGGYAPEVWQDIPGTATPKCEGVNDYPQPECVRVDTSVVSLETYRKSTPLERDKYALTGSFYLPVRK